MAAETDVLMTEGGKPLTWRVGCFRPTISRRKKLKLTSNLLLVCRIPATTLKRVEKLWHCGMAESSKDLSDCATDSDCELAEPAAKKKTKFTGSFLYKTKFSEEWKKTWPFVSAVPGNPHQFRCNVCAKNLSCGHQGVADVKDHIASQSHQKLAKTLATQPRLTFTSADPLQDKVSSK